MYICAVQLPYIILSMYVRHNSCSRDCPTRVLPEDRHSERLSHIRIATAFAKLACLSYHQSASVSQQYVECCACCRYMDMESFALEADAKGAVVMLALHGGVQANGAVQRFLEEMDVPFTGPSWRSAYLCGNQVCSSEWHSSGEAHRAAVWGNGCNQADGLSPSKLDFRRIDGGNGISLGQGVNSPWLYCLAMDSQFLTIRLHHLCQDGAAVPQSCQYVWASRKYPSSGRCAFVQHGCRAHYATLSYIMLG